MKTSIYCANCARPRDHKQYDLCGPCRHVSAPGEPTDADALIDGEWVQRGPIKVWMPWDLEEAS